MQFYLREKIFTLRDSFVINDVSGRPWFQCQAEFLTIGHKLHLYDMNDNEVAYIHQKLFSFMPQYEIWQNGQLAATLHKKLTFLHDRYEVDAWNGQYVIGGDIWGWNYGISVNDTQIASVNKQLSFSPGYFVVDIADNADIPMILCFTIVIDEVKDDQAKR